MDKTAPIRLTSFKAALIGHNRGEKAGNARRGRRIVKKNTINAMRAIGAMVILSGFVVAGAFFVIYWVGYQAKRVASKQGRQEIKTEVSQATRFIATDKDFHKEIHKEFKGTYIVVALILLSFVSVTLFGY